MAKKRIIKGRIKIKDKLAYKARKEGYRARSAYKLKEINNKFKLVKLNDCVVDIGAWPGSWLQVSRESAGDNGVVIGIDKKKIEPLPFENIITIEADIIEDMDNIVDEIQEITSKKVNVVLSDVAPATTGIREIDQHKSYELSMIALNIAKKILKRNGRFLCKIYESPESDLFLKEVRKCFNYSRVYRSTATKKRSKEIYIVAKRFHPEFTH